METVTLITSTRRWKRLYEASRRGGRYIPALEVGKVVGSHKRGACALRGTIEDLLWVAPFLGGRIV